MYASDGGGGISVSPAALAAAGGRITAIAGHIRETGSSGALNACVVTGSPALDGALSQFDMRWSTTVERMGDAATDLGKALSSASTAYLYTDDSAIQ